MHTNRFLQLSNLHFRPPSCEALACDLIPVCEPTTLQEFGWSGLYLYIVYDWGFCHNP